MIGRSTLDVGFQHAQNGVHTASALPALADYRGLFNHRLCQAPLYKFQEVCGTWYTSYVNIGIMIMLLGCSPFRDPELPPAGRGADLVSKLTRFCVEAELRDVAVSSSSALQQVLSLDNKCLGEREGSLTTSHLQTEAAVGWYSLG